jgi:DNA-binding transcriptional LysR family regulator
MPFLGFPSFMDVLQCGMECPIMRNGCAEMRSHAKGLDWDDLRHFLAVARSGTVTAAATQLGVDHATVIRRLDRLERALAAKLFERTKAGYAATTTGERLIGHVETAESAIIAGQSTTRGTAERLTGIVRIGAPDGFGSYFLAPRLVPLVERHPHLDIQLVATARLFSLSKRETDLAITLSMPKEGRIVGRKLVEYRLGLYASSEYLAGKPLIEHRSDLAGHAFVGYIEELLFTPELDYLPQVSPAITARFTSANLIAQLNATRAGMGIAVLPHFIASDCRDLVHLLPNFSITRSFWLLMHADSKELARIRAVANFIYQAVEKERGLFEGGNGY